MYHTNAVTFECRSSAGQFGSVLPACEFFFDNAWANPDVSALWDTVILEKLELAFVWNRSSDKVEAAVRDGRLSAECALANLGDFAERKADLIAEVCHPDVAKEWCCTFLSSADV
ncbi:hypothetical protein Pmar_PMAR007167, partial [Perkinsus marinus ATCC 50983]